MTETQARILFTAVQKAKTRGMRVPPANALVTMLPENMRKMTQRGLNYHLAVLQETHHCFLKVDRSLVVNTESVVTEPESAAYLSRLAETCAKDAEGRVRKEELHAYLKTNYKIGDDILAAILAWALKSGYVAESPTAPNYLRLGRRSFDQRPFIELLADSLMNRSETSRSRRR